MNENKTLLVINIILCTMLFTAEIIYLVIFNINNGIKKEEILNYINNIEAKELLKVTNINDKMENEIDKEIIGKIIETPQIKSYITTTIKNIYLGLLYNESLPDITSNEIIDLVNNSIDNNIEITDIEKQKILELTKEISLDIESNVKEIKNNKTSIISFKKLIEKTIPIILIISLIMLIMIITVINKNYESLLFIGLPTLIAGIIFLLLALSLTGTIKTIEISESTQVLLNKSFPSIIKTLKYTSIIACLIGLIEIIIYKIKKYQRRCTLNGKNRLI